MVHLQLPKDFFFKNLDQLLENRKLGRFITSSKLTNLTYKQTCSFEELYQFFSG